VATPTANSALFDATLRHQVGLRRLASGETRQVLSLLEKADRDLSKQLRERLAKFPQGYTDFTSSRWKAMIADIRALRTETIASAKGQLGSDLKDIGKREAEVEAKAMQAAIPIQFELAAVNATQLAAIATSRPFQGHLLGDWFKGLAKRDQTAIQGALQIGMAQGESIPDIMKRVSGSAENAFRDGTLAQTRRQTEAIVRTAVNHVSNEARGDVWDANSDIVTALRWTATLDGRTSPICRARDGALASVGDKPLPEGSTELRPPGARPPAHFNCRSVMVAVLDGEAIVGTRPSVTDTRRREEREADFRKQARDEERPIQEIRKEWADKNIGQVPAETTYNDWLKKQPASFQDDVLGKAKADMFRSGDVTLDQFVDQSGKELTVAQLEGVGPSIEPTGSDLWRRLEAIPNESTRRTAQTALGKVLGKDWETADLGPIDLEKAIADTAWSANLKDKVRKEYASAVRRLVGAPPPPPPEVVAPVEVVKPIEVSLTKAAMEDGRALRERFLADYPSTGPENILGTRKWTAARDKFHEALALPKEQQLEMKPVLEPSAKKTGDLNLERLKRAEDFVKSLSSRELESARTPAFADPPTIRMRKIASGRSYYSHSGKDVTI
jgi:SPP1 gp7 family putative phage head morphogenesis protein